MDPHMFFFFFFCFVVAVVGGEKRCVLESRASTSWESGAEAEEEGALDVGYNQNSNETQIVCIRFESPQIPSRARIISARLQLHQVGGRGHVDSFVYLAREAYPKEFLGQSFSDYYDDQQKTSFVYWTPALHHVGDTFTSDFYAPLQEVVDLDEFDAASPLVVYLDVSPATTAKYAYASFDSHANSLHQRPTLFVEYDCEVYYSPTSFPTPTPAPSYEPTTNTPTFYPSQTKEEEEEEEGGSVHYHEKKTKRQLEKSQLLLLLVVLALIVAAFACFLSQVALLQKKIIVLWVASANDHKIASATQGAAGEEKKDESQHEIPPSLL